MSAELQGESGPSVFNMYNQGLLMPEMVEGGHEKYIAHTFNLDPDSTVFAAVLGEFRSSNFGPYSTLARYEDVVWQAAVDEYDLREQQEQATHDGLTGLLNKQAWESAVESALKQADVDGTSVAVLHIDLDKFKRLNDKLGHAVGDKLLRAVALLLLQNTRHEAKGGQSPDLIGVQKKIAPKVGRLGGDEFAILLRFPLDPSGRRGQEGAKDLTAQERAEIVVNRLEQISKFDPQTGEGGIGETFEEREKFGRMGVGLSIGVAVREPGTQATVAELLDQADHHMLGVKEKRKRTLEAAMPLRQRTCLQVGRYFMRAANAYDTRLYG